MRNIFWKYLLYSIFSIGQLVICQTSFSQLYKPRVYLIDAGMNATLYTTYQQFSSEGDGYDYKFTLADEEIYDQLAKQIPPAKLDYVIAYSQRNNYPPDMQKPGVANSLTIQNNAVLYYMARFKHRMGDFIVVEFPAAENANNPGLSEDQRPKTDIYFVIDNHFIKDSIRGKQYITKNYHSYSKAEKKAQQELINNFDAFYNNTDKFIDTTLYFKTTVPVPHYTREQYITHQATPSAENEAKVALQNEREQLTNEIIKIEKNLIELYNQKQFAELLTSFPIWECMHIDLDTKKERPKGDLRGPIPMLMNIRANLHFTKGGNGVDMLADEIISAQEDYGSKKAQEFFTTVQHFSIEPGNNVLKNGDYKNTPKSFANNFDNPPYDYFKPVVLKVKDDFVVSSFTIEKRNEHAIFLIFKTEHFNTVEFYPEKISALNSRLLTVEKQLGLK